MKPNFGSDVTYYSQTVGRFAKIGKEPSTLDTANDPDFPRRGELKTAILLLVSRWKLRPGTNPRAMREHIDRAVKVAPRIASKTNEEKVEVESLKRRRKNGPSTTDLLTWDDVA